MEDSECNTVHRRRGRGKEEDGERGREAEKEPRMVIWWVKDRGMKDKWQEMVREQKKRTS